MKPYSLDFRQKIVEPYEKGDTSIRKVAVIPYTDNQISRSLVLKANQLRDLAWRKEQEAIQQLETLITKDKPFSDTIEKSREAQMDTEITFDPHVRPIWEIVAELGAKIPDEEWEKVPTDLSKNFDAYQTVEDEE